MPMPSADGFRRLRAATPRCHTLRMLIHYAADAAIIVPFSPLRFIAITILRHLFSSLIFLSLPSPLFSYYADTFDFSPAGFLHCHLPRYFHAILPPRHFFMPDYAALLIISIDADFHYFSLPFHFPIILVAATLIDYATLPISPPLFRFAAFAM
jgi:hypothetical protein